MSWRGRPGPWGDRDLRRLLRALAFFCVCLALFAALRLVGLFH